MSYYRTIYRAARRSVQWGATLCGVLVVTLGCVTVSAAAEGTGAADRVATHEGLLEGPGPDAAGVRRFLGVPYAQAPVGLLRWAAPQPAQHWMGTRLASRFGPRCMQLPVFSDMVFRSDGMSEDCLYL